MGLDAELRELRRLKQVEKEKRKAHEDAEREMRAFEARIHETMINVGVKGVKLDDGYRFDAKSTTFGQIEDPEAFYAWVEETGQDEFLHKVPHKRLVNELVREYNEDMRELPPGLRAYDRNYVSMTYNEGE